MNTRGKRNERGASGVEYGLMAAGIAAAIIMPTASLGWTVGVMYEEQCKDAVRAELVEGKPPPPGFDGRLAACES